MAIRAAHRQSGRPRGRADARKAGDRTADDGTTRAAHSQPPARRAHRRSGVLQRGTGPSRGPARSRTRAGPEIRQDLRHPLAARTAAARDHARADRGGLHPAAGPPAHRTGPRPGRLRPGLRRAGVRRRAGGGRRHRQRAVAQGLRQTSRAAQDAHPRLVSRSGLADRQTRRHVARTDAPSSSRPPGAGRTARGREDAPGGSPGGAAPPGAAEAPGVPPVPQQRGRADRNRVRNRAEREVGQRVTAGDIAALRSVGELFRTLDDMYGGGHARQALVRYLEHECEPMLRGTYGEQTGRRLFAATADLTRLLGWTSYDIAAHGLAQRYFVQALRLAQAAGDRAYGAYVLVTMSRQAVYLAHGREAVQLARVAQQGVGASVPPVVQALLHSAEARGHAVLGEARACTTSLMRAERALEAARPGDEVPFWARFFDEAQLADEFGHCHRDLQQYRPAAQYAERSLQLRAPVYARSRLFCRVVLATARLGLGDLDQACRLGAEAASQAADMRSVRANEYVRDFERRLEPYKDASPVRTYRDKVAALG
ncbi:sporulation protein [Streptomyces sp. e14]|nr:sporulation protein [Streptomyces sp. e14]